jgi:hypothetical protein
MTIKFAGYPEFTPNLSPKQMFRLGVFGGTYFRDIKSGVTGKSYKNRYKKYPAEWFRGLDIATQVASQRCNCK